MTCDRYWREGVLLVEQGGPDPHREACPECQRAHQERAALVAALPLVGVAEVGPVSWKQRVWDEIERGEARRSRRWWAIGGGVLAIAILVLVAVSVLGVKAPPAPERYATAITIEKGKIKKRGGAQVGDRIRAHLDVGDAVRIYRGNALVFACGTRTPATVACVHDARGHVAVYELAVAGEYTIVIVSGDVVPVGNLDGDLAALVEANVKHRIEHELSVR